MTNVPDPHVLERLLRRDRRITAICLALLCGLAWLYLIAGSGMGVSLPRAAVAALFPHRLVEAPAAMPGMDMAGMEMSGMAGMPGMDMSGMAGMADPIPWPLAEWAMVSAMWAVMMVAMMTPSAAPAILLYGRVVRHAARPDDARAPAPVWAFVVGYLLVWTAFALAATVAHWLFEQTGLLAPGRMGSQSRWFSAAILAAAGAYQLSPLQTTCLLHCRSPASFFARYWRPGLSGAARLGALHGAYCVGCCWLIMALLFVGGVMNVVWIVGLAVLVMAEKLVPRGPWIARGAGVVLLLWAVATLAS